LYKIEGWKIKIDGNEETFKFKADTLWKREWVDAVAKMRIFFIDDKGELRIKLRPCGEDGAEGKQRKQRVWQITLPADITVQKPARGSNSGGGKRPRID